MGFENRGGYGRGGGNVGGFTPKPGSGTLFVKVEKRNQMAPDYDGYFIAEFDVRAGEKIKLVGWDKSGPKGHMINLKMGRERQDAPGYERHGGYQQGQQDPSGYPRTPNNGYGNNPQHYGGRAPQQSGYQQPQRYQTPPQGQAGSYQGGGYAGGPAHGFPPQAPHGQPPAAQAPASQAPNYAFPPPEENSDLPF